MINLKEQAVIVLAKAIKGPHADHHAFVLVNGAWLRHRGNESAAYAEILAKAERYAA